MDPGKTSGGENDKWGERAGIFVTNALKTPKIYMLSGETGMQQKTNNCVGARGKLVTNAGESARLKVDSGGAQMQQKR